MWVRFAQICTIAADLPLCPKTVAQDTPLAIASMHLSKILRAIVCFMPELQMTKIVSAANSSACRSEEHTSELHSLLRMSYAVFCLQKHIYSPDISLKKPQTKTIATQIQ